MRRFFDLRRAAFLPLLLLTSLSLALGQQAASLAPAIRFVLPSINRGPAVGAALNLMKLLDSSPSMDADKASHEAYKLRVLAPVAQLLENKGITAGKLGRLSEQTRVRLVRAAIAAHVREANKRAEKILEESEQDRKIEVSGDKDETAFTNVVYWERQQRNAIDSDNLILYSHPYLVTANRDRLVEAREGLQKKLARYEEHLVMERAQREAQKIKARQIVDEPVDESGEEAEPYEATHSELRNSAYWRKFISADWQAIFSSLVGPEGISALGYFRTKNYAAEFRTFPPEKRLRALMAYLHASANSQLVLAPGGKTASEGVLKTEWGLAAKGIEGFVTQRPGEAQQRAQAYLRLKMLAVDYKARVDQDKSIDPDTARAQKQSADKLLELLEYFLAEG